MFFICMSNGSYTPYMSHQFDSQVLVQRPFLNKHNLDFLKIMLLLHKSAVTVELELISYPPVTIRPV